MNFPRLGLAALAGWVVYLGVSFLVHGVLLTDVYSAHAAVMRPEAEQMEILPFGFGFGLVGFFAFAYTYAKGYEGGSGMQEGLRFGVIMGMLICCFAIISEYMLWPASPTLLSVWLIDYIVEFTIYGMVVGLVYKPAPHRRPTSSQPRS
ncbi:MAG TPA: hypothetical protein VLD67_10690 [Vicinamibacterales bacterium]|nr:hypothetical protein [Vicinamibacterales bacterium]